MQSAFTDMISRNYSFKKTNVLVLASNVFWAQKTFLRASPP